jgi:hypothetical protein
MAVGRSHMMAAPRRRCIWSTRPLAPCCSLATALTASTPSNPRRRATGRSVASRQSGCAGHHYWGSAMSSLTWRTSSHARRCLPRAKVRSSRPGSNNRVLNATQPARSRAPAMSNLTFGFPLRPSRAVDMRGLREHSRLTFGCRRTAAARLRKVALRCFGLE